MIERTGCPACGRNVVPVRENVTVAEGEARHVVGDQPNPVLRTAVVTQCPACGEVLEACWRGHAGQ